MGVWAPVRVRACKGHILSQASEREAECLGWDGWEKRPEPGGHAGASECSLLRRIRINVAAVEMRRGGRIPGTSQRFHL